MRLPSAVTTRTGPNEPMRSHIVELPGPPLYMKVTGALRRVGAVERIGGVEDTRGRLVLLVAQRDRSGPRRVRERTAIECEGMMRDGVGRLRRNGRRLREASRGKSEREKGNQQNGRRLERQS